MSTNKYSVNHTYIRPEEKDYFFEQKNDDGTVTISLKRFLISEMCKDAMLSYMPAPIFDEIKGLSFEELKQFKKTNNDYMETIKWAFLLNEAKCRNPESIDEETEKIGRRLGKIMEHKKNIIDKLFKKAVKITNSLDIERLEND